MWPWLAILLCLITVGVAGPDRASLAVAEAALSRGDYAKAIVAATEALRTARQAGDRSGEAEAANTIGLANLYLGNFPAAIAAYQEALANDRAGGDREGEIVRLNNIGNVYYFQGRYGEAMREYQAALDQVNRSTEAPWQLRRRQLTMANLAALYQRLGRYQRALAVYLELRASPQALRPSERARMLANTGVLWRRMGDPHKALEAYREALALFAQERHPDGEIGVLKNIGIALALDLNDLRRALKSFQQARERAEASSNRREIVQARLYQAEALRRLGQAQAARNELEAALAGARALASAEDEWRALYALGRLARDEGDARRALDYHRQAVERIEAVRERIELASLKREFLADKRDVYDALVESLIDSGGSAGELFQRIEQSRARLVQDRLARPTLPEVEARLDPRTVLLEFWCGARETVLLVVTHAGTTVLRRPRVDPTELVREASRGSDVTWRAAAEQLGETLLGGVTALDNPRIRTVLIVPDGELHSLPFEILVAPGAKRLLLTERAGVAYLPSAALLMDGSWAKRPAWRLPWQPHLLALANPSGGPSSDERWDPLPGAAEEAHSIARLTLGPAEIHTGASATKSRFMRPGLPPLVHLATHARADPADPENSRILLAGDYLYLREIYGLDLRGVDLVTVSTCESEAGRLIRGEGVEGFSRALLSAGASATVTSLWRVPDRPTAEFMRQFYYRLAEGDSKEEALRRAKLQFLHSRGELAHPRYWSAFVLTGDALAPAPWVVSWTLLIVPPACALGLAVLLAIHRRHRQQHSR